MLVFNVSQLWIVVFDYRQYGDYSLLETSK